MQSIAYTAPLPPGRTEASRKALASCQSGGRKESYQDSRRRAGVIREAVWLQPTGAGDLAVIYLEADDLGAAFRMFATSPEPFDRWFRTHLREVHGSPPDEERTAPELVLDFDSNRF
jgi:hypothetical protein